MVALGITLVTSVRRRRRDLAIMRTLGLSARQLATVVAWQSTVAVLIGTVVGVPLGIVLGRQLWDLFAEGIQAVPVAGRPHPPRDGDRAGGDRARQSGGGHSRADRGPNTHRFTAPNGMTRLEAVTSG